MGGGFRRRETSGQGREKARAHGFHGLRQELCNTYHISGFPTLLVVSPEGEVVGGVGGFKNREEVQVALDKAIRAAAAISKAKKLSADKQQAALNACQSPADMKKVLRKAEPSILPPNKRFFWERQYTVLLKAATNEQDMTAARRAGEELLSILPMQHAEIFQTQMEKDFAAVSGLKK